MSPEITPEMQEAYRALLRLTPEQRFSILVWFCPYCGNSIEPGHPPCTCENDE